jgi:hypothetical protein
MARVHQCGSVCKDDVHSIFYFHHKGRNNKTVSTNMT